MNKLLTSLSLILLTIAVYGQTDSLTLDSQIRNNLEIESTQDTIIPNQLLTDNQSSTQDSVGIDGVPLNENLSQIDTITEPQDTIIGFFNIFKGEPGKAALYSLVIPGGGQIYNRKWIKAPVIILADATAFFVAGYWTREYNIFDAQYLQFVNGERLNIQGVSNPSTLISQRNTLRKYRDYSWFAAGIVHMITVIEAFVDRHLLEFDMNEDLTMELIGIKDPYSVTLASLNYTF